MLRLLVVVVVVSLSSLLAAHASAKQEPAEIPFVPNGCVDFAEGACGDTDGDGYLSQFEWTVGSDPDDSNSTPEYGLFDEQSGSRTCADHVDNDLDGHLDNGDAGCRLNCRDFGPNQRCKDSDEDGWLNYVEGVYGSDPDNGLSTPESFVVPGTCNDGVDNDLDGLVDETACGLADCIDFDDSVDCPPV